MSGGKRGATPYGLDPDWMPERAAPMRTGREARSDAPPAASGPSPQGSCETDAGAGPETKRLAGTSRRARSGRRDRSAARRGAGLAVALPARLATDVPEELQHRVRGEVGGDAGPDVQGRIDLDEIEPDHGAVPGNGG